MHLAVPEPYAQFEFVFTSEIVELCFNRLEFPHVYCGYVEDRGVQSQR